MKLPLAATFLIIAPTMAIAWWNHREITTQTHACEKLQEKARALGISGGSPAAPRRTRLPSSKPEAGNLATGLIAFAREIETQPEPGDPLSFDDREQRILDWQRRLLALGPEEMKTLLDELRAADGLSDSSRQDLLVLVMETLAESHPGTALEVFAGCPDLVKNADARANVVSLALVNGMKKDPEATLSWYQNNRSMFPGQAGEWVRENLLRGTSLINPKLAFSLIGGLEIANADYAVNVIVQTASTPAQRDATLAAFREYLATVRDPAEREELTFRGNNAIISAALRNNIDEGLKWVGDGRFTAEEIEEDSSRCYRGFTSGEHRKWLEWLIETRPSELVFSRIFPDHFSDWVRMDYRAAGDWLATAEDGPAKTAAVASYAYSLADTLPETAAQWAITLPPGEKRDNLLPRIYQSWALKNPAAADAFAEQHGIAK